MEQTKEGAYEKATMQELGGNPNGTRQDVIYRAMDIWAAQVAIAFGRWKDENSYGDGYCEENNLTQADLFDLFIKEYQK